MIAVRTRAKALIVFILILFINFLFIILIPPLHFSTHSVITAKNLLHCFYSTGFPSSLLAAFL